MTVELSSGVHLPLLGLGTWLLKGKECTDAVHSALEMGYKLIDTAHAYENHTEIAKALKGFKREGFFLTSKFWLDQVDDAHVSTSIEKACKQALKELHVDYLDLYLMHWPDRKRPLEKMVSAMLELQKKGWVRAIGVSNFTIHHLQDLLDAGLQVQVNQVEFHPYLYQKELWDFCKKHQIVLQSYRPLGKGTLVEEEPFVKLAKKHHRTPAQIILAWLMQKKIPVITKSSSKKHLQENLEAQNLSLTPEEMKILDHLNKNQRFCTTEWSEFDY
jgi:2,5-diketo-D-gluconate reductase B